MLSLSSWVIIAIVVIGVVLILLAGLFIKNRPLIYDSLFKTKENRSECKLTVISKDPIPAQSFNIVEIQKSDDLQTDALQLINLSGRETPTRQKVSTTHFYTEDRNAGLGQLHFIIEYDYNAKTLKVIIEEATNLAAMDLNGLSDPYVKAWILPDRQNKMKTKTVLKSLNPKWHETFLFKSFPAQHLLSRGIYFKVIDYDQFSKDDAMGELYFPLEQLYDPNASIANLDLWKFVQKCKDTRGPVGEIQISLVYNPKTCNLNVTVVEARDLKKLDNKWSFMSLFCKIKLIDTNGKTLMKKKTSTIEGTTNPIWNEGFVYFVPSSSLKNVCVQVSLVCKEFLRHETIGMVRLSCKSNLHEVNHWSKMIAQPQNPVVDWHLLRET